MRLWLAAQAEKLAEEWERYAQGCADMTEEEMAAYGQCARRLKELIIADEKGCP